MDNGSTVAATRAQIWVHHAWPVLLLFTGIACLFATTHLDLTIASALFFDASGGSWAGSRSCLVNEVIHTGGRWHTS